MADSDPLNATGPITVSHIELADSNYDGQPLRSKTIHLSRLRDLGFKRAKFEECSFNHTYFERCYFRKAEFINVSFVDCLFRDCNFDGATFTDCRLHHAEFHNCSMTYSQVANCLPRDQVNVLRDLARNLRVNAQNRGYVEDVRKFLLEELRASKDHNFKKAFEFNGYYRKYTPLDRVLGFAEWARLKLDGFVWGHGESPLRVIRFAGILILLFALIFRLLRSEIQNAPSHSSLLEFIGFSAATFVTSSYGDWILQSTWSRILGALEAALGLIMFGFLVAALYRRVSKR